MHGNGVVEVTARGSIQVRGLSRSSAPQFAADVAGLGIAAADGIPVLSSALAGLDAEELLDAGALAADLRLALARRLLDKKLGAKVSVVIDGGGAIKLESLSADIRLAAEAMNDRTLLRVSVGGNGASAADLGAVAATDGVGTVIRLLEVLSLCGTKPRARDMLVCKQMAKFRSAIADLLLTDTPPRPARGARDAIGMHPLRDGSLACGIGVAFGHADAKLLQRLADAAGDAGANGVRSAAGRALLVIGLTKEKSASFVAAAERLGFIMRADDPRRYVVACAGAPICASGEIASRTIGPLVAATTGAFIDGSFTIHVSGCAKGCAHAAPAALTIVGTSRGCALVANGSARDTPFAVVPEDDLPAAIAGAMASRAREVKNEGAHG